MMVRGSGPAPTPLTLLSRPSPRLCCRAVVLLAALGANTSLTDLDLSSSLQFSDSLAAAALAGSLRSNATLRTLRMASDGDGPPANEAEEGPFCCAVFGALAPADALPSRCGLSALTLSRFSLGLPACAALGQSLGCGAALRDFSLTFCEGVGPAGMAAIAQGVTAAGRASSLRSLDLFGTPIGAGGALGTLSRLSRLLTRQHSASADASRRKSPCRAGALALGRMLAEEPLLPARGRLSLVRCGIGDAGGAHGNDCLQGRKIAPWGCCSSATLIAVRAKPRSAFSPLRGQCRPYQ